MTDTNKEGTKLSIIIPTLMEKENLAILIPEITTFISRHNLSHEIIVVDDCSNDGTLELIQDLKNYQKIPLEFIERQGKKPNLGKAAIEGFKRAKGEILILMDADGSHPVESITSLTDPIIEGLCDITVGSRYVSGGSTPDWPCFRRILSRIACLLASGITSTQDATSGFIAFRKSAVQIENISTRSWKIVLDIIAGSSSRILEIPITFRERTRGKSKLKLKAALNYISHLIYLYKIKLTKNY
ncbi:MAG TPA: glycosyltransferase [Oligoflexia bacterium]|nr:glycosyltransferase [Oligoflexia bacterium]HMP49642.1 glycosyltransferase [Oligoflexia bacterium]